MSDIISIKADIDNSDDGHGFIFVSIRINTEPVGEGVTIDLHSLLLSLKSSGEYDIFTCGCGEPGCASVWNNCIVLHGHDSVSWLVPHPIVKAQASDESREDDDPRVLSFKEYWFDQHVYRSEIISALHAVLRLANDYPKARLTPYGLTTETLRRLERDFAS
jgi:hypothetical protein